MKTTTCERWRKIHGSGGIVAALLVIILAVTGILLNHTDRLELSKHYVRNNAVLDWYDIRSKEPPITFRTDGAWISKLGDRLFFNDVELTERSESLLGAVEVDNMIVVALDNRLLLLTLDGEQIEQLSGVEGVPAGMRRIGISESEGLVIGAAHGNYLANIDTLQWSESENIVVNWSVSAEIPDALYARLQEQYRGKGLPLERVILDLHSGRILGRFGEYLMDLAAVLLVFLAISGSWIWFRHRPRR